MTRKRSPEAIKAQINELSDRIKELEQLKVEAEELNLGKSKECCHDVCEVLSGSISNLRRELAKTTKDKENMLKLVETASNVFGAEDFERKSLEHQAIKKSQRIEILIKEKLTALESLKQTLKVNKVCVCR